jgi:hypothetical protein
MSELKSITRPHPSRYADVTTPITEASAHAEPLEARVYTPEPSAPPPAPVCVPSTQVENVGTGDAPLWCKGYRGADSPGYEVE